MNAYLIKVISAAVLSAITQSLAPEKWKKYLNAITGIMIISVIVSPIFELKKIDLFSDFTYNSSIDEYAQKKAVCKELEKRVSEDAANRLKTQLGGEYKVETTLEVNNDYEIVGVKEMRIWTKEKRQQAKKVLESIYSPQKISFLN